MRALLVVNPSATTTSDASRDVLVRALRSEVELEVVTTKRRGHAASLAHRASLQGIDVIFALGGDGTVNEVVNGILSDGPAPNLPLLAVVPGGSTNVFARSLGIPNDPVEAISCALAALRERSHRSISLGRVGKRWFTFSAGFGLDAEVVRRVERARHAGKTSTHGLYLRSAVSQFFADADRSRSQMELTVSGLGPHADDDGGLGSYRLAMAIVQNTSPWTYLGNTEVNPCPRASFDSGLDVFGMRRLRLASTLRSASQFWADPEGGSRIRARAAGHSSGQAVRLHDLTGFTIRADGPLAYQVDGDYIGEAEMLRFTSVSQVIRILIQTR